MKPNEPWNPWRIAAWLRDNTEAQYLFAMTTPSTIWDHFTISTAHDMLTHLKNLFEKDPTATTVVVHNIRSNNSARVAVHTARTPNNPTRMQHAANEKAHSMNEVSGKSGRQWEGLPRNRMLREHECTVVDHGKVEMKTRGGKKGAKTHGRVEEEAAAAPRGQGTVATAKTTDGVSLATPASSPVPRNDEVVLTKIPPIKFQPPQHKLETMQPIWTPHDTGLSGECQGVATSHREAVGDEVKGGETNDEVRRAHKHVDDKDSRVEMSEDKTTTATPHAPQSMPLEGEWIEQTSGGSSEPTAHETKTASARCASRNHPDSGENAETKRAHVVKFSDTDSQPSLTISPCTQPPRSGPGNVQYNILI